MTILFVNRNFLSYNKRNHQITQKIQGGIYESQVVHTYFYTFYNDT